MVSAHTTGKVINELMHQGQIDGGVVFGLGFALFFFLQAEDGIRAATVTGVQTCALPISFGRDWVCGHQLVSTSSCAPALAKAWVKIVPWLAGGAGGPLMGCRARRGA